jgi:HK97 family phage prohead protease
MTTTDVEYRTTATPVQCRMYDPCTVRSIGGYAVTFNSPSNPLPFTEIVAPSFVERSLAEGFAKVICRYNHDSNLVIGSVSNETLRLAVDSTGLDYTVDVPEWPGPPYILEMVQRGDVSHSSFTFRADFDGGDVWEYRNGSAIRTLVRGDILEVAPCPVPAYSSSTLALRSLARVKSADPLEVERYAQNGELAKLFTRSDRPPAKTMSGKDALVATLAQEYPEVGLVDAERRNRSGRSGKEALAETMASAPIDPKARLLETMAQRWPEFVTDEIAQSTGTPSVEDQLAAARQDLVHVRNEVARLSDPLAWAQASPQAKIERAEARAQDTLDAMSGQLSGAAALRLTEDARPDGVSSYVPRTETEETEPEISAEADAPRRWVPLRSTTMTGHEALRRLEAMRLPDPPRNAGSAYNDFLASI